MNQNYTNFFIRSAKIYVLVCHRILLISFVCREMKEVENRCPNLLLHEKMVNCPYLNEGLCTSGAYPRLSAWALNIMLILCEIDRNGSDKEKEEVI